MNRINTSTAEANANGAGKTGFTDGAPLEAIPPTQLNAEFFNSVQEEICGVIEGFGGGVNQLLQNQLLSVLRRMGGAESNWFNQTGAITLSGSETLVGISCTEDSLNPVWLAMGSFGHCWTSSDGVTWTAATTPSLSGQTVNFLRYSSALGQFLIGCSDGSGWSSNTVGGGWTKTIDPAVTGFAVSLADAVYMIGASTGWVVIGGNGVVLRQAGGVWSNAGLSAPVSTFAVTAIARDWAGNLIMTDAGAQLWLCTAASTAWTGPMQISGLPYPWGHGLRSVVWDGYAGWIAVGDDGIIAQSPTGTFWQLVLVPNIGGAALLAVGTSAPVGTTGLALAQAPAGGALVAVGVGGVVLTSSAGVANWKVRPTGVTNQLSAVYWGPTMGYWAAVGDPGCIINSLRT